MRNTACVFTLAWLAIGFGASAIAGVVPGRWDKVEGIEEGTPIIVQLKAGERMEGSFAGTTAEALSIRDGERERSFAKESVAEVRTQDSTDGVVDGLGKGAVIGALGGILLGLAIPADLSDEEKIAGGLVWGAGIGAGIGLAVDAAHKAPTLLYKAE